MFLSLRRIAMKRTWTGWRQLFALPTRGRTITRRQPRAHLRLEPLEDRTVPSTVSINNSGTLVYTASAGVNNNLSISWDGAHTYTITDSAEKIYTSGLFALLQCTGSGTNTLTVNSDSVEYTKVGPKGIIVDALSPGVTSMDFDLGDQSNQLTLESNGVPISINNTKGGTDAVVLGSAGASSSSTLANIQGNVTVANPSGSSILDLYDNSDTTGRTVSMYDSEITGLAPANIYWTPTSSATGGVTGLSVYGGSGGNTFNVENTSNFYYWTYLYTGVGNDTVNVYATTGGLDDYNPGGADTANVGLGNMGSINGWVDAYGPGSTSLVLNDYNDTTGRTVSMYDGELTGLAPAPIYWTPTSSSSGGVTGLQMQGGSGGNIFNVYNTSKFYQDTFLATGVGNDTVNVYATTGRLTTFNNGGQDSIDVGHGTLANIQGALDVATQWDYGATTLLLAHGATTLLLDDSGDSTSHTVTLTSWVGSGPEGSITGLAPAPIYYGVPLQLGEFGNNGVASLILDGGSGNNTYNILGNQPNAGLVGAAVFPPITINAGSGNDTVDVGGGSLANIYAAVYVSGTGSTNLYLNDTLDTTGRTVSMYDGKVTGLAPANIYWTPTSSSSGGVTSLTVDGGSGSNSFYIENTSNFYGNTLLSTGTGTGDTVNVNATTGRLNVYNPGRQATVWIGGSGSGVGSLANINGGVDVSGTGSTNLYLNDTLDTTGRTVSMYDGKVTGLAPANIYWTPTSASTGGVTELHVWGGTGSNTFNVYNTSNLYDWTDIVTGGASGSVNSSSANVYATTGGLYVINNGCPEFTDVGLGSLANIKGWVDVFGHASKIALLVDDSKDSTARTATLTSSTLTGLGNAGTITYQSGVTSLTIDGGSKGNTFNIQSIAAGTPVAINGGSGTNTLVGPNQNDNWVVNAANGGTMLGGAVKFANFQHLVGGKGVDTFQFGTAGRVLSLDGGGAPAGQGNWLDYSAFPSTSTVTVNLATGSATNVNGGAAGAVKNIQDVLGSTTGINHLSGDAQGNILIGGSNATGNQLLGGNGRSLLIGGSGGGSVTGGTAEDILIAGTTSYDPTTAAGKLALMSILDEWQQTSETFAQRVNHLKNGGGMNGSNKLLWGTTVHKSNDAFTLSGDTTAATTADWFFASLSGTGASRITDFNDDRVIDQLN
jgi:hypothetical protein